MQRASPRGWDDAWTLRAAPASSWRDERRWIPVFAGMTEMGGRPGEEGGKKKRERNRETDKQTNGQQKLKAAPHSPEAEGEQQAQRCRRRAGHAVPLWASRRSAVKNGSEREPERSDSPFPIFYRAPAGTPKGLALRGRLSLLTFFGGAKKVSGCRAAPGAPLRPEKDKHRAGTPARSKTRLPPNSRHQQTYRQTEKSDNHHPNDPTTNSASSPPPSRLLNTSPPSSASASC